jgi:hypothetical protein
VSDASDNPFTRLAERQMVAATKARHKRREVKIAKSEADAPMKLTPQMQRLADRERLLRNYRAASKAAFAEKLTGPNGANWRELQKALRDTLFEKPELLLTHILNQSWLKDADLKTRQDALGIIASHLLLVRLENGYAPFEDSLPGEELTAFEIIREYLKVLT